MELIERSNPSSLQCLLSYAGSEDQTKANLLIKMNLLSRLYASIKSDLTKLEISKYVPTLSIKVSRFKTNNDNSMYLANMNTSGRSTQGYNLPPMMEKSFSDLGVELPSSDILNDRLNSFSEDDITDPFRLTNIELEDTYSILVEEDDFYSNMDSDFYDTFYAGMNVNETLYNEKVKATCIVAIDDILRKEPNIRIGESAVDQMLSDVEDPKHKQEIKSSIMEFINSPLSRADKVKQAKRVLELPAPKDKQGKPIPTWKILTAVTLILAGVLAFTQRKALKAALDIASEPRDFEPSKFKLFTKSFFTSNGRGVAREWLRGKETSNRGDNFLNQRDYLTTQAHANKQRGKYEMENAAKRW